MKVLLEIFHLCLLSNFNIITIFLLDGFLTEKKYKPNKNHLTLFWFNTLNNFTNLRDIVEYILLLLNINCIVYCLSNKNYLKKSKPWKCPFLNVGMLCVFLLNFYIIKDSEDIIKENRRKVSR